MIIRYYLKNKHRSENLVPDEVAPELIKEAAIQFIELKAETVAAQLTLQVRVICLVKRTASRKSVKRALESRNGSRKNVFG